MSSNIGAVKIPAHEACFVRKRSNGAKPDKAQDFWRNSCCIMVYVSIRSLKHGRNTYLKQLVGCSATLDIHTQAYT